MSEKNVIVEMGDRNVLGFWCDGCRELHCVWVAPLKNSKTGSTWNWNGSKTAPTFSPSILVNGYIEAGRVCVPRCHSYVEEGRIRYLSDCEHDLAGKTVDLKCNPLAL